jgi:serine/threonine protein kinase
MMRVGDLYLQKFKITGRLGQGNFGGMVYRAENFVAGRDVALKIFPHTEDPESRERLQAEHDGARLQQQLSGDPRVTEVYSYGLDTYGDLYVEMEHVDGENLSTRIGRGPLPPGEAVRYAMEIAEMLHYFASFRGEDQSLREAFHGDLKPQNIRITSNGRVKVFDFGIAKAVSASRSATGQAFASPAYTSPESLRTNRADAALDRWALGVTLYQMVSGRLPFDGPKPEIIERAIRSGPPAAINGCSPALMNVIWRMLAQDPAQRYPDATAIVSALRGIPLTVAAAANTNTNGFPPVLDFDPEATRRTAPAATPPPIAALDSEATQRTTAPARALKPAINAHPLLRFGWKTPLAVVLGLGLLYFLWTQRTVYAEAGDLRHRLDAASNTDLEQAWQEYERLESRRVFPLLTWGVQSSLKERLVAEGARVVEEYHSARSPIIRRPRWERASLLLDHALKLDAGNGDIKARKKVIDGYLRRIDAQGSKTAADREAALTDAEAHFKEATTLANGWPEPWLALMTLYAYDRRNVEQTDRAFAEARKRGRSESTRDVILQADVRYYAVAGLVKQMESFTAASEQGTRVNNTILEYCRRGIELYSQTLTQNPPPRDARKNLEEMQAHERDADSRRSTWSLLQP